MAPSKEVFDTGLRPDEVSRSRPIPVETPWGALALYDLGQRFVAGDAWCPHLAGPLLQGAVRDGKVTCPWHSWVFSLETGACVWAPDEDAARGAHIRVLEVSLGAAGTLRIHGGPAGTASQSPPPSARQ